MSGGESDNTFTDASYYQIPIINTVTCFPDVLTLLSATQNESVIPKEQLEGVVQVKENADLSLFKTVHSGDFVISLRSFQGGFELSNYEGVITPAYTVFRVKREISHNYFKRLFKSDGFIAKINEAVTKGLHPDVPMKESGVEWIGEIPEGWEISRFKWTVDHTNQKSEVNGQNYVGLENIENWTGKYLETKTQEIDGFSNTSQN